MTLEERITELEKRLARVELAMVDETPRRDTGDWMPRFVEFKDPGPKLPGTDRPIEKM